MERVGLLTVNDVEAAYGQSRVLFGVDLAAADGGVIALLGTNGAGKSTILRVVAGLLPATRGRVVFDGRDITDLDAISRVKAGIALVPGGRGVFAALSVRDNLRLAAWLYRRDAKTFQQSSIAWSRCSLSCRNVLMSPPATCPAANSRWLRSRKD